MAQQQQQLARQQKSRQHRGRFAFASINSLQPRPDALDVKQAQQALAETVMAGLQLLPGVSQPFTQTAQQHQHRQLPPLAWITMPTQLPGFNTAADPISNSSKGCGSTPPTRRFPSPQQQEPQQAPSSSSNSPAHQHSQREVPLDRNKLRTRASNENPANAPEMVCLETVAGGRQRVYHIRRGVDEGKTWEGFDMVRPHTATPSLQWQQQTDLLHSAWSSRFHWRVQLMPCRSGSSFVANTWAYKHHCGQHIISADCCMWCRRLIFVSCWD